MNFRDVKDSLINDKNFAEKYRKWIDYTWTTPQCKQQNYKPKVFTNTSEEELELRDRYAKLGRNTKQIMDIKFTANMWVCGDYMVMIAVEQKPSYLIEIQDTMIAQNIKNIFKKLWETTMSPDTRRLMRIRQPGADDANPVMNMLMAKNESAGRRAWMEANGALIGAEI